MTVRDLIEQLCEFPDYWDVAVGRCGDVREVTVEPRPASGSGRSGEDGNVVVIR